MIPIKCVGVSDPISLTPVTHSPVLQNVFINETRGFAVNDKILTNVYWLKNIIYQYVEPQGDEFDDDTTNIITKHLYWILSYHTLSYSLICIYGYSRDRFVYGPANERRRYNVTSSLIGWARMLNYPWHRDMWGELWTKIGWT